MHLKSPVQGMFWYLYLIMDIWSRRIIGWAVHPTQSDEQAAALFTTVCHEHTVSTTGLVLYADNGGPMKGATMLATLERLGVVPSFGRPWVSDDNPYSEALEVLPRLSLAAVWQSRRGAHLGRGLRDMI